MRAMEHIKSAGKTIVVKDGDVKSYIRLVFDEDKETKYEKLARVSPIRYYVCLDHIPEEIREQILQNLGTPT